MSDWQPWEKLPSLTSKSMDSDAPQLSLASHAILLIFFPWLLKEESFQQLFSRKTHGKLNKNQSTWIFSTPKLDCCLVKHPDWLVLLPRDAPPTWMQVEPIAKRLKSTASSHRVQTVLFDFDGTLTMREANPGERVAKDRGWRKSNGFFKGFILEFLISVCF